MRSTLRAIWLLVPDPISEAPAILKRDIQAADFLGFDALRQREKIFRPLKDYLPLQRLNPLNSSPSGRFCIYKPLAATSEI